MTAARRLTSVISPAGEFDYAYNPVQLQRVDELWLPNGAVITNGYDSVARLTRTGLMNSLGTDLNSYAAQVNACFPLTFQADTLHSGHGKQAVDFGFPQH